MFSYGLYRNLRGTVSFNLDWIQRIWTGLPVTGSKVTTGYPFGGLLLHFSEPGAAVLAHNWSPEALTFVLNPAQVSIHSYHRRGSSGPNPWADLPRLHSCYGPKIGSLLLTAFSLQAKVRWIQNVMHFRRFCVQHETVDENHSGGGLLICLIINVGYCPIRTYKKTDKLNLINEVDSSPSDKVVLVGIWNTKWLSSTQKSVLWPDYHTLACAIDRE